MHRTFIALLAAAALGTASHAEAQARWSGTSRAFYINQYMDASYKPAIQASDDTWNAAGARFTWTYGGESAVYPKLNNDATTVVDLDYTTNPDAGAETITRSSGGYLTDADIIIDYRDWLNYSFSTTSTVPSGKYDLQSVMSHEFGHAGGLADDYGAYANVMYYQFYSGSLRRALTTTDKNRYIQLYGAR